MKICFAFLINDIINNEKVWYDYLNKAKNIEIVIHCAKSNNLQHLNNITKNIYVNLVPTKWGRLLKVENFLLQKSKELNCDKCIFLSSSCLPIKRIYQLFDFLNNDMTIMGYSDAWDMNRFPNKDIGIKYMANQQWIIIDKRHYDVFLNSDYRNYFEESVVLPEESYYSTIMELNKIQNEVLNKMKMTTYVDWSRSTNGGNSPYVIEKEEDVSIIDSIKQNKNILFIRKVSNNCHEKIINKIKELIDEI
jgi:hypothetical protein